MLLFKLDIKYEMYLIFKNTNRYIVIDFIEFYPPWLILYKKVLIFVMTIYIDNFIK